MNCFNRLPWSPSTSLRISAGLHGKRAAASSISPYLRSLRAGLNLSSFPPPYPSFFFFSSRWRRWTASPMSPAPPPLSVFRVDQIAFTNLRSLNSISDATCPNFIALPLDFLLLLSRIPFTGFSLTACDLVARPTRTEGWGQRLPGFLPYVADSPVLILLADSFLQ